MKYELCRYCECPTEDTDKPLGKRYPYKTVERILALITDNDEIGLRNLSQQNIQNAFYKIRFGILANINKNILGI